MFVKNRQDRTFVWRAVRKLSRRRTGFTMSELVVAAVILFVVMSFVTSICFRINLVWKDVGQQRIARAELANQLETLTRLEMTELQTAVDSLRPSEDLENTLRNARLTGQLVEDKLGIRIVLQLDWDRKHPGQPVELAGWVVSPKAPNQGANQDSNNQDPGNSLSFSHRPSSPTLEASR